jgi:Leucine-rich repeat (LRR) protein
MKMIKEELIHLWMANGFIFSYANLEVESVGNMIWIELCQKSFFQDIKIDDYSGDTTFKMNSLVHDLAQSIMGRECFYLEDANMTSLSKSTHHISFDPTNMLPLDEDALKKVDSLRTFYQLKYPNKSFGLIPNSHSLRVLCAKHFQLSSLKSFIHLRYLELHDHDIETLPDSIYSLQKLEILKLKHFSELRCLPEQLTCLGNLRHLVIEDCYSLSRMFPYVGKLSSLRTLSVYIVKLERGHSLAELNDLNLGGKLSIEGLENVGNLYEAQEANLLGKTRLSELCLSWSKKGETETRATSHEQVLEMLQPHSNLKSLKICYYEGLRFPSWLGILSSLVSLELQYCKNCASLSPIGKLPYLKKLQLLHLDDVQYLDDECDNGLEVRAFPSLEELSLEWLFNIEKLLKVDRGGMFPCLSNLNFHDCPKLELPFLPSVKDLFVVGCNNEILRSISGFHGLNTLYLGAGNGAGKEMTSFPAGMLRNLSYLKDLTVADFPKLKELSNEPFNLALEHFPKLKELPNEPFNLALEHLHISCCAEFESLPEQIWEGLRSLRTMEITGCKKLRSLPKGIRHLTSLEVLTIYGCPALERQLKEKTGEDWDKIAHIPKLDIR